VAHYHDAAAGFSFSLLKMERSYPDRPIVGAGAVILHDGKVALVRRAHPPRQGEWSLPGGVVELGETLRHAAEREALEETGLVVKAREALEIFESIHPDVQGKISHHYVVADFFCALKSGELRAGGDAAEVRWAAPEELAELGVSEAVHNVVKKALLL
jgi:ADP-ribose pyrophosphatase YjhB (NUDIX family)